MILSHAQFLGRPVTLKKGKISLVCVCVCVCVCVMCVCHVCVCALSLFFFFFLSSKRMNQTEEGSLLLLVRISYSIRYIRVATLWFRYHQYSRVVYYNTTCLLESVCLLLVEYCLSHNARGTIQYSNRTIQRTYCTEYLPALKSRKSNTVHLTHTAGSTGCCLLDDRYTVPTPLPPRHNNKSTDDDNDEKLVWRQGRCVFSSSLLLLLMMMLL